LTVGADCYLKDKDQLHLMFQRKLVPPSSFRQKEYVPLDMLVCIYHTTWPYIPEDHVVLCCIYICVI
jgi:hypothetical protein